MLLRGAGCKVKEQHLIQLLLTIKEYYPAFPDKGTLEIDVWEKSGDKLKSLQDSGVSSGVQNLLTWGLVRTALMPIWSKKPELVTEGDKEYSSEEEVMHDVTGEQATEVLPAAPPEDLPHSQRSLLQLWECSSLRDDSLPRGPENSDRYPVRAMQRCLWQAAKAGDLDALSAFPIIVKGQRNVHEPLPFSLYKDLKKEY